MPNKASIAPPLLGQSLGLDYKRWTLDCVVKIAHAVALDFSDRPELYQQVADDTAAKLVDLQANYGFDANFPDVVIRQRLMKPIFGESDGHGSGNDGSTFQTYRLPVLAAAADFAENAQPTAFAMLRERVRSEIVPFKTHLADLQGASLSQTERRTTFIFDIAQTILKDPNVFVVFGINGAIDPAWPLQSSDPQGAKLIETITTQLLELLPGVLTRENFVRLQRIGEKGFQSIGIILDADIDDPKFDIDTLITELYAWGSSLRLVGGARPQPQPSITQPPETAGAAANSGRVRSQPAAPAQAALAKAVPRPTNVYNG
jgi:hypothetical protein